MKKRTILIGVAFAGCAVAAVAVHNIVQHARHDLVTLNVTRAPLAKVLARVTRQTGERIVADQNLGGTVTLNVRKAPLRRVLGQIADQVGGFARLNFAVARSQAKLTGLRAALREGRDPTQLGWTNLTAPPQPPEGSEAGPRIIRRDSTEEGAGAPVDHTLPHVVQNDVARGGPGGSGVRRLELRAGGEDGPGARRVMMVSSGPDGVTHTIDLSPQRLLLDSDLAPNLPTDGATEASAEAARQLARRAGGKTDSLHTIESLPLPPGGLPPDLNRFSWKSDEEGDGPNKPPTPDSMEASIKRHRFEQLTRQTPEQRARSSGGQSSPGPRRLIRVEEN